MYELLVLSNEEIRRRITAARILRGLSQKDLQDALSEDGFGKRELGRIERGELPLTRLRRQGLVDALGVPEKWFTAEAVDEILGLEPGAWKPSEAIAAKLAALEQALKKAAQAVGQEKEQDDSAHRAPDPRGGGEGDAAG